jgi:hypothetical protein
LRLVAEPRQPRDREAKWIERAEEDWGAWGTVYRDDDGRVLGSMQYGPAGALPPRSGPSGRPAVGRRDPRHVRVPPDGNAAVGRAVAVPRGHRRGPRQGCTRARGVCLSLPRGDVRRGALSSSTARSSRRLPRGLRLSGRCGPRGGSSSPVSSSAASNPSRKARARRSSALSGRHSRRAPAPPHRGGS